MAYKISRIPGEQKNMLILKIFINDEQIDEIFIKNEGEIIKGVYRYSVKNPKEKIEGLPISHRRKAGWRRLVIKALREIEALKRMKKRK